jgi:uncharacterized delta-60 repeat protein
VAAAASLLAAATATARDGAIDPSFAGGRAVVSFGPGAGGEGPSSLLVQRSGAVFSAGNAAGNGWGLSLHDRRGNPLGLGGDGLAYHQIAPGPTPYSVPVDFVRQPDGRWLGAGFLDEGGPRSAALARFTAAGDRDTAFGNDPPNPTADGVVRLDFPGTEDFANGVALDRSGRILAAGTARTPGPAAPSDIWVGRFAPDGSRDGTFAAGGIAAPAVGTVDQAEDVRVLRSGRILVAGVSDGDLFVLRLRPDGSLDPSFGGGDGIAETPGFGIESESNAEMVVLPDGRIVVGVNDGEVSGFSFEAVAGVARFTAKGVLDRSFSGDGKRRIVVPGDQFFGGIAVADDGRIVVNSTLDAGSDDQIMIVRLLPGGGFDRRFADGGILLYGEPGVFEGGGAVAVGRDRRIAVGGSTFDGSGSDRILFRLLGDTWRPGTKIVGGPRGEVAPGRYRVRFRAIRDVHTRFRCALSVTTPNSGRDSSFRSCGSSLRVRVASGAHYLLRVRAIDRAGNVDKTPAKRRFSGR